MLLSSLAVVCALVTYQPPSLVHPAMAAALMMGNEKRYEPPTPEVVAVPDTPMVAKELPAPAPSEKAPDIAVAPQADTGIPQQRELPAPIVSDSAATNPPRAATPKTEIAVPPSPDGKPQQRALPAPIAGEGGAGMRLAQAPSSNDEILKRLERLEQENQKLRQELDAKGAGTPAPGASGGFQPRQAPAQMIGGWRVSLFPWNAESYADGGAIAVFNTPNQRLDATLGQKNEKRFNQVRRASTDMFVYKLEGWLHVTKGGRHELGFEVNCGFDHPCNLVVNLGGVQIINRRAERMDNKVLQAGLDLEPGDYPVEIVWGLSKNRFIKFEPARVALFPLYRPPGEYNYRTFGPRELLTESNPSIPMGLPRR